MIDPKKPLSNPALKEAAAKLRAENNPVNLNAVINEMTRAVFLVPANIDLGPNAPRPDAAGKVQLPKDSKINFLLLNTKDGKSYFMAFTDWDELHKWRKDPAQKTMMLRFDDLAGLLAKGQSAAGFVVNPFGDNLRFEAPMVASIMAQKNAAVKAQADKRLNRIKPGDKVTIVEPSVYPDALVDPICEVLQGNETVAAAYLQLMIVNDTDKSYLLVLDGPKDDKLFAAVAQAAKAYLTTNEKKMDLNITISASPLGQQGMRGSEAFYLKGKGRIYDEDDED